MQVVLLAAGLSTRLRPLTDTTPKPMLPVLGKPLLEYIVRQVVSFGLTDIFITTHFQPDKIRSYFGDGREFGARIRYAHEETLMNTAGSLKLIQRELRDHFLVVGGNDLLPDLDLDAALAYHRAQGGIGTIVLKELQDPTLLANFGQALLGATGRVKSFVEKPERTVSRFIHTTYQVYDPRVLDYVPEGIPCSIPEWMIGKVLAANEPLFGYVTTSPFVCISTKEQYERSHEQLMTLSHRKKESIHESPDRLVHHQDLRSG